MNPYLRLLKPATLIPVVIGAALFTLLAEHLNGASLSSPSVWLLPVGAGLILAVGNFYGNTLGEWSDRREDALNPRTQNRAVVSGAVTPETALTVALLAGGIAALAAFWINLLFGTALMVILLFAYLYQMPPVRLKRVTWVGNAAIATPRGFLGIWAAWLAGGGTPLDWRILFPCLVFAVYVYCANVSKDLPPDLEADRAAGIRTIPVVYGEAAGRDIVAIGAALPLGIYLVGMLFLPLSPWFLLIVVGPVTALAWMAVARDDSGWRYGGRTVWAAFYSVLAVLALAYVLPLLA